MTPLYQTDEIEEVGVACKRLDNGLDVAVVMLLGATVVAIENWCRTEAFRSP